MDELLKKVAALDNFDLPILTPEFRAAYFKHSTATKRPNSSNNSPVKNNRSDDGLKGTRSLTVEQRHALLEPLGRFNFEEFSSRNYPTACEADYRLSLAQVETCESDECSESEPESEPESEYESEHESEFESESQSESESESGSVSDHSANSISSADSGLIERLYENEFGSPRCTI